MSCWRRRTAASKAGSSFLMRLRRTKLRRRPMAENARPILFSAPMIRAFVAGAKTQTRRICKYPIDSNGFHFDGRDILCQNDYLPPSAMLMHVTRGKMRYTTSNVEGWESECPYGAPGDLLWAREAWRESGDMLRADLTIPKEHPSLGEVVYAADRDWEGPFRPSIHMPRWASRLTLRITEVRVQRLQEISEADCFAGGMR